MAVDAGSVYAEVRIKLDKLKQDIKQAEAAINKIPDSSKVQASKTQQAWDKSFKAIQLAGVAAFASISLAVKGAVSTFAGFEQSMANVASVAGATAGEFALLEEAARQAGESTRFSASQAADALYYLASAGLDAKQSVDALDGVLQLAGATQSDLAFTAEAVTAAISQFGLQASEASRVANVYAAAIGNSQANMEKLSTSMRYVGPVAASLGISIEQTVGALQALYDAGFKGEQAGAALRNVLGSLANAASPTAKKLEALGVAFENINPETNSLAEIIGVLGDAALSTGDIMAAFGEQAGPVMLSLLSTGKSAIEDYTKAVTGTSAAAEMYTRQNDTLAGSIDAMKSAAESATIGLVKEFEPAIRAIVDAIAGAFRLFNALPGPVKVAIAVFAAGVPTVAALTAAFGALGGVVAALSGPLTLIVGGLAALTGAVLGVGKAIHQGQIDRLHERFGDLNERLGVTDERLIKIVQTSERLGATGTVAVQRLAKELVELQKELGLTDQQMDSLVGLAKDLGATSSNVTSVTAQLARLSKETGLGVDQMQLLLGTLRRADLGQKFEETAEYVKELSDNVGLSVKQIAELGATDKEISKEMREQLITLAKQEEQREEINRIGKETNDIEQQINEKLALRTTLRKQEAQEQKKLTDLQKELQRIDEAIVAGVLTEEEGLKRKLEIRQQIVDKAKEEALAGTITSKQALKEIAAQQGAIRVYTERLAELEKQATDVAEVDATPRTDDKARDIIKRYTVLYEELGKTEEELIEINRRRALEEVDAAGLTEEAAENARAAINRYYDALLQAKQGAKDWKEEFRAAAQDIASAGLGLAQSLTDAYTAFYQADIDRINANKDKQIELLNERLNAELEAKGLAEETELERLQRELEAARQANDTQKVLELQKEIERLKIVNKYAEERKRIEEEAARKTAMLQYKAELAGWRMKLAGAIADAAAAIVNIWSKWAWNPFVAGTLTAGAAVATGAQIAALQAAKPEPPTFATGGIVVPAGSSGREVIVAENGSPELLLNAGPEGSAFLDLFASRIANRLQGAGGNMLIQIQIDGQTVAETAAKYYNNGQVRIEV